MGEPKSAEGLQVLVSGRAVPALLRTGEDGAAPAGGSGMLDVWRKMPCRWRRAHVELQLRRSSYNSWTWREEEENRERILTAWKLDLVCRRNYVLHTDQSNAVETLSYRILLYTMCILLPIIHKKQICAQKWQWQYSRTWFRYIRLLCQLSALKDKPNTPQVVLIFETRFKCIFAKVWLKQLHLGVLM